MEILFGVMFWTMVVVWMGKEASTSVIYSLRGEMPPRQRIRLARIERGEVPPRPESRYGGREWFDDLMEDALTAMTRSRRQWMADRAAKKAAEREKQRRDTANPGQRIDDLVEAVREQPRRRPSPRPRPAPGQESADVPMPDAPTLATELTEDAGPDAEVILPDWEPRHRNRCSRCGTVSDTQDTPMVCPKCGADDSRLSEVVEPDGDREPATPEPVPADTPDTPAAEEKAPDVAEQTPTPVDSPDTGEQPAANTDSTAAELDDPPARRAAPVIPLFQTPPRAALTPVDDRGGGYDSAATRSFVLDAAAANGRCTYPVKGREYGICRSPVNDQPSRGGWPGNPHCPYHTALTKAETEPDKYQIIDINPPTEENTMQSGETTHITATRTFFGELGEHVTGQILPRLEQCSSVLAGKGMDPAVLAEITNAREQFTSAVAALETALEKHDALNRLMEEAVNNTEHAAETDYYKHA